MSMLDAWLHPRVRLPRRFGGRVLVLCRTRSTLTRVRRWLASKGGAHGIDVATPASLAMQVWRPRVLDVDDQLVVEDAVEAPEGTLAAARIGPRPGLAAAARRWTRVARLAKAARAEIDLPDWLSELACGDWGLDEEEHAITWLLEAVASRGSHLGEGAEWDRVVALGFEAPIGIVEAWELALVRGMGATPEVPSTPPEAGLPFVEVPDVTAEARLAVLEAAKDPDGTVILVAHDATARRVRDALRRSGHSCAWRDRIPLRTHALASAVVRCAGWFGESDPWIQVADLSAVFHRSALGRRLHPAAEAQLSASLDQRGLTPTEARLTRRGVVRVLERSRLLEAPLSRWLTRLSELSTPASDEERERKIAARAAAIEVRLRILEAVLAGREPGEALAEQGGPSFDDDDFEDILAELLGDVPGADAPEGHTLGAIKAFLVACRVHVHDDPVARAILAALGHRTRWPATAAHVHHALSGAVDPGVLADGVDVVAYEDWDGRPCRQILLLDVHDKGVARRPAPDPLLTDHELRALGAASGGDRVRWRLEQARRAAAAAPSTLAIVTQRDADGREVVAPIRLDLVPALPRAVPSYGIALVDLPETAPLGALVRHTSTQAHPPEHADDTLTHLAIQATAEWYREGRGPPLATAGAAPAHPTLADLLGDGEGGVPGWVAPYMGVATTAPEAVLPVGPHSATGLLREVSHCMFQAFARRVVELRPANDVTEDLDPREVGNAVHDALQRASRSVQWRVPKADRAAAEAALVRSLEAETGQAFVEASDRFGALSEAREASAQGRLERWNRHWPAFAASRLGQHVDATHPKTFMRQIRHHPAMVRAVATVRDLVPAVSSVDDWLLGRWLLEVASHTAARFSDMAPGVQRLVFYNRTLPEAVEPDLPAVIAHPDIERLRVVIRNLRWRARTMGDPVSAIAAEVSFGDEDAEPVPIVGPSGDVLGEVLIGPVDLPMGGVDVSVRGRIDRLMVVPTPHGPLLEVTDYKTGRVPGGLWRFRRDLLELRDPQLLVYALVMQHVRARPELPEPLRGARVAAVAWDHVRKTYKQPERRWDSDVPDTWMLVDTDVIEGATDALGALLGLARSGRWPLRPREDTCPQLSSFGHDYCPYVGACRLRGLQAGPDHG